MKRHVSVDPSPSSRTSEDGTRRYTARNVKRSLAHGRWDVMRVWTLKVRAAGRWVVLQRCYDEQAAEEWVGK